jgi:ATP-dependent RNA helicase SUPV3L1/SUV3
VAAVLGPTNTGKTHYAIERMLAHRTGVIGLPLRLLAREVYDKIVALRGPSVVALVTGEERIVPPRTQYWVCTVEAMPVGMARISWPSTRSSFAPIPSAAMSSPTGCCMRAACTRRCFWARTRCAAPSRRWCPAAQFMRRERMSELTYARLEEDQPDAAAQRHRRVFGRERLCHGRADAAPEGRGGGGDGRAVSPRTRNAQVELYQNGDVDYLVATDAIGMGLNLDIKHVAFSGCASSTGADARPDAQRAGADRGPRGAAYERGTFGVTGEAPPLDEGVAEAIMEHRFAPVQKLWWRNSDLEFGSVDALIASLEERDRRRVADAGRARPTT